MRYNVPIRILEKMAKSFARLSENFQQILRCSSHPDQSRPIRLGSRHRLEANEEVHQTAQEYSKKNESFDEEDELQLRLAQSNMFIRRSFNKSIKNESYRSQFCLDD